MARPGPVVTLFKGAHATMNMIAKICRAIEQAPDRPDVVTLSDGDWLRLKDDLNPDVQAQYRAFGFYRIGTHKRRPLIRSKLQSVVEPTVEAIPIRTIPVVAASTYADLMTGHRSTRVVLDL
jgi:hypothetical protein